MADQMARDNTERRVAVVNSSLGEYPVRPGAHTGCANIDVETAEGNTAVKVIPITSAAATAVITLVVRGPRRLRPTKRSIPSKAANNPTPTAYWGFNSTRLATPTLESATCQPRERRSSSSARHADPTARPKLAFNMSADEKVHAPLSVSGLPAATL